MSTASWFYSVVMACHKFGRHRYPLISLVWELSLKVYPDLRNFSIFLTQSSKSMVQVGSRLYAWYEFTHIHGHIFVLRTTKSPEFRSPHLSTMPCVIWLACRRLTRASCFSRLSLLVKYLSYPWLTEEESPSSFRLRTFCEYRYCRKNKLDKNNKIWAALPYRKKTYLHCFDVCCVWSEYVKKFQHPPYLKIPINNWLRYSNPCLIGHVQVLHDGNG